MRSRVARRAPTLAGVKGCAVRGEDAGAALDGAGGERDVGGDADVAGADAVGDPLVGGVGALGDHDDGDEGVAAGADAAVGDEGDRVGVALGDADGLVADGAGVGVDVDHGVNHAGTRRACRMRTAGCRLAAGESECRCRRPRPRGLRRTHRCGERVRIRLPAKVVPATSKRRVGSSVCRIFGDSAEGRAAGLGGGWSRRGLPSACASSRRHWEGTRADSRPDDRGDGAAARRAGSTGSASALVGRRISPNSPGGCGSRADGPRVRTAGYEVASASSERVIGSICTLVFCIRRARQCAATATKAPLKARAVTMRCSPPAGATHGR